LMLLLSQGGVLGQEVPALEVPAGPQEQEDLSGILWGGGGGGKGL